MSLFTTKCHLGVLVFGIVFALAIANCRDAGAGDVQGGNFGGGGTGKEGDGVREGKTGGNSGGGGTGKAGGNSGGGETGKAGGNTRGGGTGVVPNVAPKDISPIDSGKNINSSGQSRKK